MSSLGKLLPLLLLGGCAVGRVDPETAIRGLLPPSDKICIAPVEGEPDLYVAWCAGPSGSTFACVGVTGGAAWNVRIDAQPRESDIFMLRGYKEYVEVVARNPDGKATLYLYEREGRSLRMAAEVDFAWVHEKSPVFAEARFPKGGIAKTSYTPPAKKGDK